MEREIKYYYYYNVVKKVRERIQMFTGLSKDGKRLGPVVLARPNLNENSLYERIRYHHFNLAPARIRYFYESSRIFSSFWFHHQMMMIFSVFDLLLLILALTSPVGGESPTCLAVYREGGATAVFQSPKCPRWTLSNFKSQSNRRLESRSMTCQSSTLQGRRKSQEDRTLCAIDLRIPFPGTFVLKIMSLGILVIEYSVVLLLSRSEGG